MSLELFMGEGGFGIALMFCPAFFKSDPVRRGNPVLIHLQNSRHQLLPFFKR